MKVHIGIIEEIIEKNSKPTLELRVRIPILHGTAQNTKVTPEELPIVKPIITPGTYIDLEVFKAQAEKFRTVMVQIYGNLMEPTYTGFVGDNETLIELTKNDIEDNFTVLDGGTF